jgi:hypothetical protein
VGPEGDELLVQLAQTTLKRLVSGETAPNPAKPPDLKIGQQSFRMLFNHAYERILKREIGQFERDGARKKDFGPWFEQFFARERTKIEQDIEPLAMSFLTWLAPQADLNGNLSEAIDLFAEWHTEAARQAFTNILAGKMDEYCNTERINEGGKRLAECLAGLSAAAPRALLPAQVAGAPGVA